MDLQYTIENFNADLTLNYRTPKLSHQLNDLTTQRLNAHQIN